MVQKVHGAVDYKPLISSGLSVVACKRVQKDLLDRSPR
jgi:hypothetical protein